MTTIVDLQMVVDTSQVVKAREELKGLGDAAKGVAGASTTMAGATTTAATANKTAAAAAREHTSALNSVDEAGKRTIKTHAGVNRELLVLTHELSQGQYKRFGGSLLVLAEQTNFLGKALEFLAPLGLVGGAALAAVAVAAGATAYAMYQAHQETIKFNSTLALTNDFANLTRDSFQTMSRGIADTSQLTFGGAKDLVLKLAASGTLASKEIDGMAKAITAFSSLSGMKLDDTTKKFGELADNPVKFTREIDKMMHIFSPAQIEMIEHLQNTGHQYEAMQKFLEFFNQKMSGDHAQTLKENIGIIDTIIKRWTDASAMMSKYLGLREGSQAERRADLRKYIKDAEDPTTITIGAKASAEKLREAKAELLRLDQEANEAEDKANKKAAADKIEADGKAAHERLAGHRRNHERLQEELKKNAEDEAKAIAGGFNKADAHDQRLAADEDAKRRFGPRKTGNNNAVENQQYTASLAELEGFMRQKADLYKVDETKIKTSLARGVIDEDEAAKQTKDIRVKELTDLLEINRKRIAAAEAEDRKTGGKKGPADKKRFLAEEEHIIADIDLANAEYEEKLSKHGKRLSEITAKLGEDIRKNQAGWMKSQNAELAKLTMTGSEAAQLDAQMGHAEKWIQLRERTRQQFDKERKSADELKKALAMLDDAEQFESKAMADALIKRKSLEANWTVGAKKALREYQETSSNVAQQTAEVFKTAMSGMENSLANFVTTGKFNFGDLARSIIADIVKMEARAMASKLFGLLMGAGDSYGSAGNLLSAADLGPQTINTGALQNLDFLNGLTVSKHAKGGVFGGPTMFGKAGGGLGILGEEKPEAVMPLSVGADGSLGVRANGGSSGTPNYTVIVQVTAGKDAQETGDIVSQKVMSVMRGVAQSEIRNAQRVGGQLNPI